MIEAAFHARICSDLLRQTITKPRSALVLYGSETGNAQDVAEEIARLTERLRFETTVIDLDSIELVCAVAPCTFYFAF